MHISSEEDLFFRNLVKKELRKRMRGVRATFPATAIATRSTRLVARVLALPLWNTARTVGLFWPKLDRNEVDVRPLFSAARTAGKRTAFPRIDDQTGALQLCFMEDDQSLAERGHNFAEPPPDAPVAKGEEIDLIVVPALALDALGHRIGYGAGYYDKMLPLYSPPACTVGVAFDFQLVPELPATATDIPVALVVTDIRDFLAGALSSSPSPRHAHQASGRGQVDP